MKFGIPVHHVYGYHSWYQIFQLLPMDLIMVFQICKRGKIITKLWKIITKSLGKI